MNKAEQTAERWAATVAKLRAEVERRKASGRETKALDRAIDALRNAEARAVAAIAHVEDLARAAAAKAAKAAVTDAPMIRRLDKIAASAPALMGRWAKEREEEPKRLAKRKKHLKRATTMDLRPETSVRRDRPAAIVEASTFPSGPIIPYVPPKAGADVSRPGLLPGDYRLLDSGKDDYDAFRLPKKWTAAYVGKRLADAHATLRRLPMTTRPKEFGGIWPEYVFAAGELAVQAGSGTLTLGRNRIIGGTSAADVARMNEALSWAMQFLSNSQVHARAVNKWAYSADGDGATMDRFTEVALDHIAKHLNAKKVEVS